MNDEERKHSAQAMLAIPLFHDVLAREEAGAINRILSAQNNEGRQAATSDLRGIRNFRCTIETLAKGQSTGGKPAPA